MANILIISDAYWDDPFWASRHYIPKYLAKEHKVVFVERATALVSPLYYDVPWSKLFKGRGLRKVTDSIFIYSPLPRLPFDRRYRIISHINQSLLAIEINHLVKKMNMGDAHIVSFDHKASTLFKKIDTKGKRCYYVVDEISEFNWPLALKEVVLNEEADTIKSADINIATSKPLMEKCLRYNQNVSLISHGVDMEIFSTSDDVPEDISGIKKPIVGFVGKIEEWIDINLIAELSSMLRDISFVIIGPINVDITPIRNRPNIYLMGPRRKEKVPQYLKRFDCGIIPFKVNNLTYSVNPLKMYEYLAARLPVVSTPMQPAEGKESLGVYVETQPEGFAKRIRQLIMNDTPILKEIRIRYAQSNSWEERANQLMQLLESNH